MSGVDDPIRDFKTAVFGSNNPAPTPVDVELLHGLMRWPADSWLALGRAKDGHMEYFVHWLNGNAIGTWALTGTEPAEMHASVRPISSLTEVKLGASLYDHGSDIRAVRFATLRFSTGDDIEIDVKQWLGAQRERADQFIDEVLDALTASTRG